MKVSKNHVVCARCHFVGLTSGIDCTTQSSGCRLRQRRMLKSRTRLKSEINRARRSVARVAVTLWSLIPVSPAIAWASGAFNHSAFLAELIATRLHHAVVRRLLDAAFHKLLPKRFIIAIGAGAGCTFTPVAC